ncbi:MAG: peptidylprolyl isomerase [Sphingomonadaceae bacterium]|uniref:peptidylprolyl isomerase n=1 Tax=Thermaurantiacus sp. TaxID=2820283 RepID=UPI00298EE8D8|nr:peptidylprolyl isomerase [Thermaurantiacus sp.]MCS6987538.1 peptidylprolyl isomerase [Sphingomonadaceae bacterium]MDW8415139.1 peptidylprolyl isomerase [Thermaurantiacus sp.]
MRRPAALALVAAALVLAGPAAAGAREAPTQPHPDDPENLLHLDLSTGGRVTIRLRPDVAPKHVERIKTLARRGFYDGVIFHRVIDGFMAQTGDPTGTGRGESDLPDLPAEFNDLPHVRGAVSMARTEERDSANSQFFIMFEPVLRLDRNYTVFGRVISGMQWVDAIPRGEPPAEPARILQASVAADGRPPPDFAKLAPPKAPDLAAEAAEVLAAPPR